MSDLINDQWLLDHIEENGANVNNWSWAARNKAASEALHNCNNAHRLKTAMVDFFADHSLKHLYMEDAVLPIVKTREIVWNYLEPDIVEQINRLLED